MGCWNGPDNRFIWLGINQSVRLDPLGRFVPILLPAVASSTATCSDHSIAASAVRTTSDVQAFVQCAAEYLSEHGTAEARRAFNEDERWNHGSMYVFVDGIAQSGEESIAYVSEAVNLFR